MCRVDITFVGLKIIALMIKLVFIHVPVGRDYEMKIREQGRVSMSHISKDRSRCLVARIGGMLVT